jgi:putative hydrolase of the HAD superfamily
MNIIRAVFFDAVGTLIHPEPAAALVYARAARLFGSRHQPETIAERFTAAFARQEATDRHSGWITSEQREWERWRTIVSEVLDDAGDAAACFDYLYSHFARPDSWRCQAGVEALCDSLLTRGYQVGLASNFDGRLHELLRELTPLRCLCNNVVVSFEVGFRKPAPEFFHAMCERTGLLPADILYVGDDPDNDVAGPDAVGMPSILFDPRGRYAGRANRQVSKLDDIIPFLGKRAP